MKKRKRNLCVLLLSILMAAAWSAAVLDVSAYFSHQNEKNNVLKTGDNTSHIEEEFEPPDQVTTDIVYPKKVTVKNDSHTPCYVRAFVEVDQPNLPVSIDFDTKNWTEKHGGRILLLSQHPWRKGRDEAFVYPCDDRGDTERVSRLDL